MLVSFKPVKYEGSGMHFLCHSKMNVKEECNLNHHHHNSDSDSTRAHLKHQVQLAVKKQHTKNKQTLVKISKVLTINIRTQMILWIAEFFSFYCKKYCAYWFFQYATKFCCVTECLLETNKIINQH
jgi:hypothetical protein